MSKPISQDWRIDTLGVHAGRPVDRETGAVTQPLHMATTYERDADGTYSRGHIYGRSDNPTRQQLEAALAALESGTGAAAFASGMAAVQAVLHALKPGDHVLLPKTLYHGVTTLSNGPLARWGLTHSHVDMTDLEAVEAAITPATALIWAETPANPTLALTDLEALSSLAKKHGLPLVVDSTTSTPVATRPLALGADLVMQSTTKYLAGHSDVTGGAVIARDADHPLFAEIKSNQTVGGAVPSPFDCWLLQRGLQTLGVRVRAASETALTLARFLEGHPAVSQVLYPGLESHPQFALAQRQMAVPGGMLSFVLKGSEKAAKNVAGSLKLITQATSFGGTHTLIEHRATIEGESPDLDRGLLRLSAGLEHADDLMADLREALGKV